MDQTIRISGLHHVGVVVENLEASIAWYCQKLGFEHRYSYGWAGVKAAFIGRGSLNIEFFQNEEAAPMAVERRQAETNLKIGGIGHFAVEVPDIDEAVAMLGAAGVEIVSHPREVPNSGGSRFAFIHDNEGMLIELFQSD